MKEPFFFSVIIPTYNTGKIVCETLDSLVDQTFKNFEVIISDDGSKDDTLDYVKNYSNKLNLKILSNPNWGGPARPRNIGIQNASAEWVAFLDHDDVWFPEKLQLIYEKASDCDVIFHNLAIFGKKKTFSNVIKGRNLGENPFLNLMIKGNAIANSGAAVRKKIIEQVGFIDESKELLAVEDYDLWLKIAKVPGRFCFINSSLGGYRLIPGQNMTAASLKQIARYTHVVNKYLPYLSETQKKSALALLSYSCGRIYYKLSMHNEALENFKKSFWAKRSDIKIKSLIGMIQIFFKRLRR